MDYVYTWSNPTRFSRDSIVETYFEIAELRELPAAVIEATEVRFRILIMNDFVGADVATLGEFLPTGIALVWAFSSVPSFVRLKFFNQDREIEIFFCTYLQVSKLRKATSASRFFAWL